MKSDDLEELTELSELQFNGSFRYALLKILLLINTTLHQIACTLNDKDEQ